MMAWLSEKTGSIYSTEMRSRNQERKDESISYALTKQEPNNFHNSFFLQTSPVILAQKTFKQKGSNFAFKKKKKPLKNKKGWLSKSN